MARYITTELENIKTHGTRPKLTNPTMAQRMIGASICAYDVNNRSSHSFPSLYWDPVKSTGPVTLITADASSSTPAVDAAFITRTTDDWIVLSLRGTEPPSSIHSWDTFKRFLDDWIQDSHSNQVAFFIGNLYFGSVHQGFYKAFNKMKMEIFIALNAVDWSTAKGLQITGHSKGASLCFLYALWAKFTLSAIETIEVNAFAPTPVGDNTFTFNYNAVKMPTTRHMRYWDCVPYILPFYSQALTKYDFYHYMHSSLNPTEEFFHELGKEVTGGYSTVGAIIFYTNEDPAQSTHVKGAKGLDLGFWDLIGGIKNDEGLKIAEAHSAVKSYYPAVMKT